MKHLLNISGWTHKTPILSQTLTLTLILIQTVILVVWIQGLLLFWWSPIVRLVFM